jgi:hypothetical protein
VAAEPGSGSLASMRPGTGPAESRVGAALSRSADPENCLDPAIQMANTREPCVNAIGDRFQ